MRKSVTGKLTAPTKNQCVPASGRPLARRRGSFPSPKILSQPISARSTLKHPGKVKAVLLGALAYFIMPLDTIPDFLAVVGFSDDIAVLTLAIATVRSNMTDAHREAAKKALADFSQDKASD
jgi:hypothetical protein